ncbi:6252_t:CDS:2 [Racocetra fulgida]|uniref:6252_t:CDS:1 n=1 Tax=Racocetra fulgida TaxID=60492 RepID=A0A9N9BG13_9GLOM|nr:6252_t:CDS:2 [Racocetra fulgida]
MTPTFVQAGHNLKAIWMKEIGNKREERITISDTIADITLDVIGLTELAKAYDFVTKQNPTPLYVYLCRFFPFIRKLPTNDNYKFYDAVNTINNVSEKLLADQKNSPVQGTDLLSILVKANYQLPVNEQLTHPWALYFLAKNPDFQDRLRKELLDIFPDRDYHPTFDQIEKLKFLDCTVKETLRFFPPASNITTYNFLPFGTGARTCLGIKMAVLELKCMLAVLIRNFEFKLVEGFTFGVKYTTVAKPLPGIDLLVSRVDC